MEKLKLFTVITLASLLARCSTEEFKPDDKVHYVNLNCKIVEKGIFTGNRTKHGLAAVKIILLQNTQDTTMYMEWNDNDSKIPLKREFFYNCTEGDKVHFQYILKSRFFRIDRKETIVKNKEKEESFSDTE